MQYALWLLVVLLVAVGLAGIVLPALPGVALILAGLITGAWIDNFQRVGWGTVAALGILTALAFATDYVAAMLGAKRAGASKLALVGAAIGTIGGLAFGLIGVILGPFVGAAAGELIERGDWKRATTVGWHTWIGLLIGSAVKVGIAFTMIGLFIVAYIW